MPTRSAGAIWPRNLGAGARGGCVLDAGVETVEQDGGGAGGPGVLPGLVDVDQGWKLRRGWRTSAGSERRTTR